MTNEQAVKQYPHFLKLGDDGVLEMYLDNQMLSTYRKCAGAFVESHLKHTHFKGRAWSLIFGQYFHKCMEYFYQGQRANWEGQWEINSCGDLVGLVDSILLKRIITMDYANFVQLCLDTWKEYNLDEFADQKQYKTFDGVDGAILLFSQYFKTHFHNERYRYVGWELSFGKAKEVPIGFLPRITDTGSLIIHEELVRFYYCGRIDLIIDNSSVIGPMDHKTTAYFDGNESSKFKPHDGMQGYVYSVQKMLGDGFAESGRQCNSIIINHVSLRPEKDLRARFKHSIKSYTPGEMQEWLGRQQDTFKKIYELVVLERPPNWNTENCNSWYYSRPCGYKIIHELPESSRDNIRKQFFEIKEPWTTL